MNRRIRVALLTAAMFGTLYTVLGPLRFPEYLLTSGSATVRVEALRDIPEYCNSNPFNRYRSSTPGHMSVGYCGSIKTDHGSFQLPESRFYLFGQSREEIWGALKVGCVYNVDYFGYYSDVYKGSPQTNRYIPTFVRVDGPIENCQHEEQ